MKTIRRIGIVLAALLVSIPIPYLFFSFIQWNPDVSTWHRVTRFFFLIFVFIDLVITVSVYIAIKERKF
ncbi:hypothetical protein [Spirosoma sordidisoli]|nr:hypothetical protein [Spirosoma sordidisoli]